MPPIPSYFRNYNGLCAFPLSSIPDNPYHVLAYLESMGFTIVNDNALNGDVVTTQLGFFAGSYVGTGKYARNARPSQAPLVVNCSSFVSFLYREMGVTLPRLAIQQSEMGALVPDLQQVMDGDLLFTTGLINRYRDDPEQSVGHVAIVTGAHACVHAEASGIRRTTIAKLLKKRSLRLVRRYVHQEDMVILVRCPPELEIETADDIYWLLTKHL